MKIAKSRVKQIIQEELNKAQANEAFGIQGHEPEAELVTVTADELIKARHAAYHLVKRSLESGADPDSLLAIVVKVYGGTHDTAIESVPSHILELFSDDKFSE